MVFYCCTKNILEESKVQMLLLVLILMFFSEAGIASDGIVLLEPAHLSRKVSVTDWKTIRDARVVKQDRDYSCSAAAVATLLNEFYGQSVTEEALLKAMDKGDLRASLDDMQRALPQFGFRAAGYAATYEQLTKLKMPVMVYLKHRKDDHFSILRGINENTVWLADPSLGNRTYSREQFLEMWETRKENQEHADLKGKFLAILPIKSDISALDNFFTKAPTRQTAQAVEQLAIRNFH